MTSLPLPLLTFLAGISLPFLLPLLSSFLFSKNKNKELYSDAEPVLLNLGVRSRWMNMGWWVSDNEEEEEGEGFEMQRACERLVRKLAKWGELKKGLRMADVGYGCGDSILLWLNEFEPKSVTGFTSLTGQCDIANRALERWKRLRKRRGLDDYTGRVELKVGDGAIALTGLAKESLDVVVSIDSAYHYKPRHTFLTSSHFTLNPSGLLLLTDLCLPSHPLTFFESLLLRTICYLSSVPSQNLLTIPSYISQLEQLGFEQVEVEDWSEGVFDGFLEFMRERGEEEGGVGGVLRGVKEWKGLRGYAKVVRWFGGGKRKRLLFVGVKAKKKGSVDGGNKKLD